MPVKSTVSKYHIIIIASVGDEEECEFRELERCIEEQQFDSSRLQCTVFKYNPLKMRKEIKMLHGSRKKGVFRNIPLATSEVDLFSKKQQILIEFINNYVFPGSIPKSEKYYLLLWGHAAGLGFFFREQKDDRSIDFFKEIYSGKSSDKKKDTFNRFMTALNSYVAQISGYDSGDEALSPPVKKFAQRNSFIKRRAINNTLNQEELLLRFSVFTASDMNRIFSATFGQLGIKIDLLLCVNCYTQMVEVSSVLSASVKNYVASQTSMPFAGFHYSNLFGLLNGRVLPDEHTIIKNIIHFYPVKYVEQRQPPGLKHPIRFEQFNFSSYSLNGIDLTIDFDLMTCLSGIASILSNHLDLVFLARKRCGDLSTSDNLGYIDLGNFLKECLVELRRAPAPSLKEFAQLLNEYRDYRSQSLIAIAGSPTQTYIDNLVLQARRFETPIDTPTFLSVFLPLPQAIDSIGGREHIKWFMENMYYEDSKYLPPDLRDSEWVKFVRKLYYFEIK